MSRGRAHTAVVYAVSVTAVGVTAVGVVIAVVTAGVTAVVTASLPSAANLVAAGRKAVFQPRNMALKRKKTKVGNCWGMWIRKYFFFSDPDPQNRKPV